ncbi:MAG: hypothetical protein JJ863_03575 [Deltaproteobacteria bacterium]|nr:hypothetical protein [Deltaproteobacteria bacterium]
MHDEATRREKVHALAGLLWPAMVLVQLVLFAHASRGGAVTFLPWAEGHLVFAPWLMAIVGAALVTWLGLSAALRFRFGRDPSMRRLRWVVGAASTIFAVIHGWLVWGRITFGGADARALWVMSVDSLSHTGPAWGYAFGAAALALQLEQSAAVASEVFAFPRRERNRLWYRLLAIVLSALLLLLAYDGLAALIGGQPLLGGAG